MSMTSIWEIHGIEDATLKVTIISIIVITQVENIVIIGSSPLGALVIYRVSFQGKNTMVFGHLNSLVLDNQPSYINIFIILDQIPPTLLYKQWQTTKVGIILLKAVEIVVMRPKSNFEESRRSSGQK